MDGSQDFWVDEERENEMGVGGVSNVEEGERQRELKAVSYTHLTLPTKRIV